MTQSEIKTLTDKVIKLVQEVGEYVRAERERIEDSDIEVKGVGDFVSHADREAENQLRAGLLELLPESSVMAEEMSPEERGGKWRWIVDPIDGTANYLTGLPVYCICVALEDRRSNPEFFGPIVIGVVGQPGMNAMYDAYAGGGARKNSLPIQVADHRPLQNCTIATAFPFRRRELMGDYLKLFQSIYPRIADIRRVGSAAADLCWVADGTFDGYFEMNLKPWDVAAGSIIIKEAGGQTSDWWGNPVCETGWVLAGGENVYCALRQIIDEQTFVRPQQIYK
ncbi:MAG TPA: inositol monophosphatase [Bacteroidetes bacterium]|nr:inositol-1-monophosphatase [bacterium BMS3Bbin04]HDO65619.1 inositol monophosphatase [Bacteroidota bacterium]HEX04744.1 inositol monophosphatase [Bacteroidota bacterium]